jgi:hypothetical protein
MHSFSLIQLNSNHFLSPIATDLKSSARGMFSSTLLQSFQPPQPQIIGSSVEAKLPNSGIWQIITSWNVFRMLLLRSFTVTLRESAPASAHSIRARRVACRQTLVPHLQAAPLVSLSSFETQHEQRASIQRLFDLPREPNYE